MGRDCGGATRGTRGEDVKKRPAYVCDLSPATRAVLVVKGPLMFFRGRDSFTLNDAEARKLAVALAEGPMARPDDDGR